MEERCNYSWLARSLIQIIFSFLRVLLIKASILYTWIGGPNGHYTSFKFFTNLKSQNTQFWTKKWDFNMLNPSTTQYKEVIRIILNGCTKRLQVKDLMHLNREFLIRESRWKMN